MKDNELDNTYCRIANLMEADVGDELVALDPGAGSCFGFNSVATIVWRSLVEPQSFQDLATMLLNDFAVERAECETDLQQLLDDMVAHGLIKQMSLKKR